MGNSASVKGASVVESSPPPVDLFRTNNVRASVRSKLPMPADQMELERRFTKVLASMDLPPDKAKVLKQYDIERKWDLICDQERVQAKDPPSLYLKKLRTYLDPKASRSAKKRKMLGDSTSTQVLRDLEISLRTNHIEWVKEFLNDEHHGLDYLINYLSFRLMMMRAEVRNVNKTESDDNISMNSVGTNVINSCKMNGRSSSFDSHDVRRRSRHAAKLKMGDTKDDIHICIMCLRAIMNNKHGFSLVIQSTDAINGIALSLTHKSPRTKALVLELLAAICLVKGGHEIIVEAFDHFKEICQEKRRFETLMGYFMNYEVFHVEFMVACMQFINIIVHSVNDMNYRVHLQYEFTQLGLDNYLEKLRYTESEELQIQISAYLDNVFDVAALMEDSETKTSALEKVADLEDELGHAHNRLAQMERDSAAQITNLERLLVETRNERDKLREGRRQAEEEAETLRRESAHYRASLDEKNMAGFPRESSSSGVSSCSSSGTGSTGGGETPPPPPPPPPLPSVAAPPPPPPLISQLMSPQPMGGAPPPPPPPGLMQSPIGAMTIKRQIQTKNRLPTLNWAAMRPNQVRGTVFCELDDGRVFNRIDFNDFEDKFKMPGPPNKDNISLTDSSLTTMPSKRFKKSDLISLLEHNRLRNIAISKRKIGLAVDDIARAVTSLDLRQIPLETVELLMKMIPTEVEAKKYKKYLEDKKDISALTEEDRLLLELNKIANLPNKLNILHYMGNFNENVNFIAPQIEILKMSSKSVRQSSKFKGVLEVVLAFGNYVNSAKRGPAYGFKLQSLDSLTDLKTADKKLSLINYIANTIKSKLPELMDFDSELRYIEKAATISLENLESDVKELEKGMESVRRENSGRGEGVLIDFLTASEERLRSLQVQLNDARNIFRETAEYFGECSRTSDPTTFFSFFVRFVKAFKAAEKENEEQRRAEEAAAMKAFSADTIKKRKMIADLSEQEAVINELKNRSRLVQEMKLLQQDEVYNGALEDILLGLRNYRGRWRNSNYDASYQNADTEHQQWPRCNPDEQIDNSDCTG
ncbi:Drf_GBD [Nesidiocoris tenuis]|uniref:Drf_GBD n=1 Tax=Nesidiocoris tenuis TaxID=355587 RepID=A0ABN7AZL0_9HEMI|nr:Drf_GBD [Nesidiocoris tenuis]